MYQQSILDSLQNVFGQGLTWQGLTGPGMESQDIASAFARQYDIEEQDLPSEMFQAITPEMLRGASYKTYAPQIEAGSQTFLDTLRQQMGGMPARQAAGGFASSGGFGQQQAGVRDVYGKSMGSVLGQARQQQTQGRSMISDLINQWHTQAQRIKGY